MSDSIDVPGVIALIGTFSLPAIIIVVAFIVDYKKKKKHYETLLKALELGKDPQQIKELLAIEKPKSNGNGLGFLKGGVVVAGIGMGLAFMALVLAETDVFAPAALLLVLGLSLVVVYYLVRQKSKKK
jgi:hypothetical protein